MIILVLVSLILVGTVSCSPDSNKRALLVVSFGTSYQDTREKTLDETQIAFEEKFSSFDVYRAFTAQTIIDILEERDDIKVNNVKEALEALKKDNYGTVVIQSLHVMNGAEYDDMVAIVDEYKNEFNDIKVGKALLTSHEDYNKVIESLATNFPERDDQEAIVFMGHGTHHEANAVYAALEYAFEAAGYNNVFVGTVEGFPTLENVMSKLEKNKIEKVILMPLMIVAGDHAENDMGGDEEDSWKTILKQSGYEVEVYMHGMGENKGIREIFMDHAEAAIEGEN
ncbi:MAG: sirohydrochlorin cobaltochelatase [Clostridiales bacterium]|nr:sirohydrochlorin cobaltochelatase [Clostridiales bacterium]